MFEYPLIRLDNRANAEKLQSGDLFMLPSLYYQQYDTSNSAINDVYDGSIPCSDKLRIIEKLSGKKTSNERLIIPDRFIKCFIRCDESDFTLVPSGLFRLSLSDEKKDAIRDFKKDSALIIFSPSAFINQVQEVCRKNDEICECRGTIYLDDDEYLAVFNDMISKNDFSDVPFLKQSRFKHQQEYRICVHHQFENTNRDLPWKIIEKEVMSQPYSMRIGTIKDSCIISISNLLNNGILLDKGKGTFYLSKDDESV